MEGQDVVRRDTENLAVLGRSKYTDVFERSRSMGRWVFTKVPIAINIADAAQQRFARFVLCKCCSQLPVRCGHALCVRMPLGWLKDQAGLAAHEPLSREERRCV